MYAVLLFADEGAVFAAWHRDPASGCEKARFRYWVEAWRAEKKETATALQS